MGAGMGDKEIQETMAFTRLLNDTYNSLFVFLTFFNLIKSDRKKDKELLTI